MTTNEIRAKFLKFFESKSHTIAASDSLVPKDDPTVLFTTAGMQQFKRQFLGHIDDYTRAVTSQKCLRTDDLDEVGATNFHHTFFEMLGNFSFGDYFKKEAIAWGWEFLTKELNIPEDKIWVSVYKDDTEAKSIWLDDIHLDPKKIVSLGDKSNFWPSDCKKNGPNGPCGPCSEIFYDYGENPDCDNQNCNPDCDCGRFSEIWNLVFTQFNRKDGGKLEALPSQNIDTGMGLERLASVIQGKKNNFETDIFAPILDAIDKEIPNLKLKDKRIVADHMRAICFGISDGVVPSNEGRGYVIKKLIIDITDKVLQSGLSQPIVYKFVDAVCLSMNHYKELAGKKSEIVGIIQNIETAYIKVRKERTPELRTKIQLLKDTPEPQQITELGQIIFTYHDTYGLTVATIAAVINEENFSASVREKAEKKYNKLMKVQQAQSRASSKMTGDVFTETDLDLQVPKTDFLGYEHTESTNTTLKLFAENKEVSQAKQGDRIKIVLDQTPFYAESGGQVGDSGFIHSETGMAKIINTKKTDDVFIHIGDVTKGTLHTNQSVKTAIDVDRRLSIMRNHTATHLMQSALREILGGHVKQQGSLVDENRLRFDFTHPKAITSEQKLKIEKLVNVFIRSCDTITINHLPIEEAKQSGALAFFAEKYGTTVRVVSIGRYSKEFCGGTHLGSTGQIGLFKITSESAIAQGIRRIEAKTGLGALTYINDEENQLEAIAKILKASPEDLLKRVQSQSKKFKQLEKDYEALKFEAIKSSVTAGLDNTETLDGISLYTNTFENIEIATLRKTSDFVKQKLPSSLIILGAKSNNNAAILIVSSDDAVKRGFKANDLIKEAADKIGGHGGGRPEAAQAGGKNPAKVDEAVKSLTNILKDKS